MATTIPQLDPNAFGAPQSRGPTYVQPDTAQSGQGGAALAQAGQSVAQDLEGATAKLTGVALEEKRKHDEAIVLGKDAEIGQTVTDILKDPTPGEKGTPKGYLYTRGETAIGGTDRVLQEFDRRTDELLRTTQDQDQKRAIYKAAQARRSSLALAAASHEGEQIQASGDAKFSASLTTNVSQGALMFRDPNTVQAERNDGLAKIEKWGSLNGWSTDQVTKAKRDFNTAFADSVIRNAAATSGLARYAKGLLSAFVPPTPSGQKPDATTFDGTKLDELTKLVKNAGVQEEALSAVALLRDKYPRDIGRQVAEAVKNKDAEVANATVAHLTQRNAIDDKADADKIAGLGAKFYQWWINSGPPGERADPSTAPAELVSALRDGDKVHGAPQFYAGLEGLQRADQAQAFHATPTPAQLQQDGLLMADMVKNPAKYAQMSPETLMFNNMGLLTHAQLQQVQARHATVIASFQGAGSIALPPKVEQLALKLGKDSGLIHSDDPKLMTAQDAINLATVRDAIRTHEQAWRQGPDGKGKGDPPETKYLEWLNTEILQKGAVKGGGTLYGDKNDVTRAAYLSTPKYAGKPFVIEDVKQIPPSDLKGINEAATRRGITLTPKAQLEKYNQLLQQRAQPPPAPVFTGGGEP